MANDSSPCILIQNIIISRDCHAPIHQTSLIRPVLSLSLSLNMAGAFLLLRGNLSAGAPLCPVTPQPALPADTNGQTKLRAVLLDLYSILRSYGVFGSKVLTQQVNSVLRAQGDRSSAAGEPAPKASPSSSTSGCSSSAGGCSPSD
ncbi:hypothetical protein KC330_g153 [Hortaea werneckii]|nr:hypothetical protein KC330_g153 [Hortaea werneckii]